MKKKRLLTLLAALLLLVVFLSSAIFIVVEADHDCTGNHCSICHHIRLCQGILEQLYTIAGFISIFAAMRHSLQLIIPYIQKNHSHLTLITLKVKLSN